MSRREQKFWTRISMRLKPVITVLARASINVTAPPISHYVLKKKKVQNLGIAKRIILI
jgi:hypothetical protein